MTNRTFKIAAWLFLVAIFVATDGPISFRPRSGLSPNEERFLALGVVGFLFSLAYPRRLLAVFGLLLLSVSVFEYLLHFVHGRHGTVHDAIVKCLGVAAGVIAGTAANRFTSATNRSGGAGPGSTDQ